MLEEFSKITVLDNSSVNSNLGLFTPENVAPIVYTHFITVAFPTEHKFNMKVLKTKANGTTSYLFEPTKFGSATMKEQHAFIKWTLTRHILTWCDKYNLFFELTEKGNLHIHGRIISNETCKDLHKLICRAFDMDVRNRRFTCIRVYDHQRWNDYENKTAQHKLYQKLDLPNFTNL